MKSKYLVIFMVIAVIALLIHQYVFYGVWFEPEDLHHETWMFMFGFGALLLYTFRR